MTDRIVRKHRISVDLDSNNQFRLLKTYFNMKNLVGKVLVQSLESRHGYHVLGEFRDRTPEQNMTVRRMLCDCGGRLELDESRILNNLPDLIETLFYLKIMYGEVGGESDYNILSFPFWGNGKKWYKRCN